MRNHRIYRDSFRRRLSNIAVPAADREQMHTHGSPLSRCALAGLPMHGFRTQKVCGSDGRVNATFWRAKRILAEIIFPRTTEVIRAYV